MPEINGANQDRADPESIPVLKAYIEQQVQIALKQYEDSQPKRKKWRNSWRSASPITKGGLILTSFVALATIANAIVAWRTLDAMKSISADNTQQTQKLLDSANQIKNAGWVFSGAAIGINNANWGAVGKLQAQVDQVRRSADASREALHISQRAYIADEGPIINWQIKAINFRMENKGHIPARDVHFVLHINQIIKTPDGGMNSNFKWIERRVDRLDPGVQVDFGGVVFDPDKLKSGDEWFHLGLVIEYNDGFAPRNALDVNEQAFCSDISKETGPVLGPCLISNTLDLLKKADEYPNPMNQIIR